MRVRASTPLRAPKAVGCAHSGIIVVRLVLLQGAVSNIKFGLFSFRFNVYCSETYFTSWPFHYCGGKTKMWAKLG